MAIPANLQIYQNGGQPVPNSISRNTRGGYEPIPVDWWNGINPQNRPGVGDIMKHQVYGGPFGQVDPARGIYNEDPYAPGAMDAYMGYGDFYKNKIDAYGGNVSQYGQAVNNLYQQTNKYGNQVNRFGAAGDPSGRVFNQMYNQSQGRNSIVEAQAQAQRQQAMGDVARQGAMGARGNMGLAAQMQSINQASNVGANMAAQVAAAKRQEQQAAQQMYLQARQQQIQNQQGLLHENQQYTNIRRNLLDAQKDRVGMYGDYGNFLGQQAGFANQTLGGIFGMANDSYGGLIQPLTANDGTTNIYTKGW